MKPITIIFDLDHTLIDSSHRQEFFTNGALNLSHWRENSVKGKIFADKLILPMLDFYKKMHRAKKVFGELYDFQVIACTARVMSEYDFQYLKNNDLHFDTILSRPVDCTDKDHLLKEWLLRDYASSRGYSFQKFANLATMIDDNLSVLQHLARLGFSTVDALKFNKGKL